MNRGNGLVLGASKFLAVLVAACGSSDPAPAGGSGTGGATASTTGGVTSTGGAIGATGGSGGASGGTTSSTGGSVGTGGDATSQCLAGTGQCNNPTDCAIQKSDMEAWEPPCASSSLGAAGATATCMVGHGLTQGCAECWGAVAACGASNCFTQCLADPNGTACRDCTAQNCDAAFATCSGI